MKYAVTTFRSNKTTIEEEEETHKYIFLKSNSLPPLEILPNTVTIKYHKL